MKNILFGFLHAIRLTSLAAWWNRKRVVFLCYHGVTKRPDDSLPDPKGLQVNHRRFAAHLDYLQRHYHVISLGEYLSANLTQSSLPEYCVVLTFDDGFRNFLTAAAPLLAERRMPATVFLITDRASDDLGDEKCSSWTPEDDTRHLSWAEAHELKVTRQVEFGSHTCSHSGLLTLSQDDIEHELLHSLRDLGAQLSIDQPALSYPKGQYSTLLAEDARKVGYACAVTTDGAPNEPDHDLFTLGRTLIGDGDNIASLAVRVSGLRWWLTRLRAPFADSPAEETPRVSVSAATPSLKLVD
jgi:peptidoglycan/xylan/chitin deacetylase (PgdA/CDA1 family)